MHRNVRATLTAAALLLTFCPFGSAVAQTAPGTYLLRYKYVAGTVYHYTENMTTSGSTGSAMGNIPVNTDM
jgi:hypothetical protein